MELSRSAEINSSRPEPDELFARAGGRHVLFITTKGVDYIRNAQEIRALRRYAADVTVLAGRGGSYPTRLAEIYARLMCMPLGRYDMVVVGFAPQLVLPLFHRRFRGKTVWEDFFISFYDTLVNDRKEFRPGGLGARLARAADRTTLAYCDQVIADTRADADYFAREFGVDRQKIAVCYLEADNTIYFPRPAVSRPANAQPVVLYFGSVLPLQGADIILRGIRLMAGENIRFDFIGPLPDALRREFGGLPNLKLTPWLPQTELAARIAAADLCLAGHFNGEIGKAARTIPGKAYIYRAMGKPMILGDNPANRELFGEDGRTFFVRMGDPQALADGIRAGLAKLFPPPAR